MTRGCPCIAACATWHLFCFCANHHVLHLLLRGYGGDCPLLWGTGVIIIDCNIGRSCCSSCRCVRLWDVPPVLACPTVRLDCVTTGAVCHVWGQTSVLPCQTREGPLRQGVVLDSVCICAGHLFRSMCALILFLLPCACVVPSVSCVTSSVACCRRTTRGGWLGIDFARRLFQLCRHTRWLGVVCCLGSVCTLQPEVRASCASTHCVKMVVVVAVRLLARVCFRCLWSPSYTAAGINSILGAPHVCYRVRARLTDPASLRCDAQVLAAAAEEEQEEEEEAAAAVVSPSGCALPFARCCYVFVTSYPTRGPTRRVHSPFTFLSCVPIFFFALANALRRCSS